MRITEAHLKRIIRRVIAEEAGNSSFTMIIPDKVNSQDISNFLNKNKRSGVTTEFVNSDKELKITGEFNAVYDMITLISNAIEKLKK